MPKLADKVLVVDDDLSSLDLIAKQVLGPLGYQVIPVTDGGAAIQQAGKTSPDALIVSLSLRGFSGRDLLTALRSQGFEAPIIVIAPAGGEAQALAAFRLGARDYLVRPLREAEIVTVMDRVIGESRMRRERAQLQQQLTQANADMEQRLKEMTALSGLGKAVTNLSDAGLLFNRLVESALFVTGANMGWLLLADETTGQLTLHASKNLPVRVPLRQPWDDGLAPLVMMSGEALNITGPGMNQFKISQVAKAALVAPIRAREQTVGVLTVANAAAKPFNDRHQTLLSAVSDYASIAIVNVRLFQVLESRARSYQQAYDELKAGQKEKDELFEKLGADMRVPLGAARQYVELALAEESSKLNNRLRSHLKLAAEKLNRATRVLEEIFSAKPSA